MPTVCLVYSSSIEGSPAWDEQHNYSWVLCRTLDIFPVSFVGWLVDFDRTKGRKARIFMEDVSMLKSYLAE